MNDAYTILFREPTITGKRAMRLSPDGTLTSRKIFAAMIRSRDYADKVATDLRQQYPDATVTVQKF